MWTRFIWGRDYLIRGQKAGQMRNCPGDGDGGASNSVRQGAPRRFAQRMGFFDRLAGKSATPSGANGAPLAAGADSAGSGVTARLFPAREKLEQKDLPGAMAIYEEVLADAGDRPDVLVMISGDL